MSATTTPAAIAAKLPRQPISSKSEPLRLKILEWGVFVLVCSLLVALAPYTLDSMKSELVGLSAWLVLVAVSDLLPVPVGDGITLALSLPILLAAGMLYPPVAAGLVALIGSTDLREIRREISVGHGLYNRSQIALSVMAASWVFHWMHGDFQVWPFVLPVALSALITDFLVNWSMVALYGHVGRKISVGETLRHCVGRQAWPFMISYTCFGLVAVLLAVVYQGAGNWGLLAFVIPVVLARQLFVHIARLRDLADAISEKTRLLLAVSEKIADERRDERLTVAAGLHDELLPPLYKVHLMGQVLRQDLATGQLLALDEDLPELLGATAQASEATQALIRDLRHSAIGAGGLVDTLRLLVREVQSRSSSGIELQVEEVGGSPVVQLLAYQVAREGLRNAVRHAGASLIAISLALEGSDMRLVIEDDGEGFDPRTVDREQHFGLELMRERVELAGGVLHVESTPGEGTRIIVRLPAETSSRTR